MIGRIGRLALIAALLASAGVSRAAAANREHQQIMADIRMLQEQAQHLALMLGSLAEALKAVTGRLDEQSGANRKAFADQKLLVDSVAGDVRVVREKVDETNVRITSLSQELEALRLAIPSTPPLSPSAGGESAAGGGGVPGGAPVNPGVSPQRLYETAESDFMAGHWTLAIQGFETYIRTFPKSEKTDDAQYYIGETYLSDSKFKEAVSAYDHVINNYPSSNKMPETYYKRGLALERLGQIDRARESYEFVIKNHPESDAGRLARQALDRLSRSAR